MQMFDKSNWSIVYIKFGAFNYHRQISINRMLFTKVKRQTEEIELLREELGKLKARTFANFTAVQRWWYSSYGFKAWTLLCAWINYYLHISFFNKIQVKK